MKKYYIRSLFTDWHEVTADVYAKYSLYLEHRFNLATARNIKTTGIAEFKKRYARIENVRD